MGLFRNLLARLAGLPSGVTSSISFSELRREDMTVEEAFLNDFHGMTDTYRNIDDVRGKWISGTLPNCRSAISSKAELEKYDRKLFVKFTGVHAAIVGQAAAVMAHRLQALADVGLDLPSDQRLKRES